MGSGERAYYHSLVLEPIRRMTRYTLRPMPIPPALPRTIRILTLGALPWLALLLGGCEGCSPEDSGANEAAPSIDRSPAPLPEGVVLRLSLGGGQATLEAGADALPPGALRAAMPRTPAELLSRLAPLQEPLLARIVADSALHGLRFGPLEEGGWAMIARIRLEADEAKPLGEAIPLEAGGPRGSRWIALDQGASGSTGDGSGEEIAAALIDELLIVAESRERVAQTLPFLAFTAMAEPIPAELTLIFPEGTAAMALRGLIDAQIEAIDREGRAAIAAEQRRRARPADVGEPSVLLGASTEQASELAALLPDLGEVRVRLLASAAGIEARAHAVVRPGSPLAERIAGLPRGPAYGLRTLPRSTALAFSGRLGRADGAVGAFLARLAGERIESEEREALLAALRSMHPGEGGGFVLALGAQVDPLLPWFAFASEGREADPAALARGLSGRYASSLLGMALGCPAWTEPGPLEVDPRGLASLSLCEPEGGWAASMHFAPAGAPSLALVGVGDRRGLGELGLALRGGEAPAGPSL
ncbi:MAG: hypothetical protein OEY14_08560, partial [Myxococcales bacterium]|nr:hypothetical protein [Myxococcales bacterium]